jgi:predicted ATP-grasp superfamily ATP-dependent carboligase
MRSGARILVTDAQDACGLAVIRCVGAAGGRVTGASLSRAGPGLWSRWCANRAILPDPRDRLSAFIEELAELLARHPHDVVIPGRDETLYAISAGRDRLGARLPSGLPDHDVVERALDKGILASAAAAAGLAVPDQRICGSYLTALAAAREFGWPVLVKPVATAFALHDRVDRHPSRIVRDVDELHTAQSAIGECIVQRHVEGRVVSFGGVATERGVIASVVSRYLRTWPPEAGQSSYTESIPLPAGLLAQMDALVMEIGWTGIFELELLERGDGVLHAIDFNPRPYGSIGLARAAGAPLAALWCDVLLGDAPSPRSARVGIRFRSEQREAANIRRRLQSGEYRSAAAMMRPRSSTTHSIAQLGDPVPALVVGAKTARRAALAGRKVVAAAR